MKLNGGSSFLLKIFFTSNSAQTLFGKKSLIKSLKRSQLTINGYPQK